MPKPAKKGVAWVTAAHATHAILANATPIIFEAARDTIAFNPEARKTVHAFIEGELIAFNGGFLPSIRADHQQILLGCLRNTSAIHGILKSLPSTPSHSIGYNPKKHPCFYQKDETGAPQHSFLRADFVIAMGWHYRALGGVYQPLEHYRQTPINDESPYETNQKRRARKATSHYLKNTHP